MGAQLSEWAEIFVRVCQMKALRGASYAQTHVPLDFLEILLRKGALPALRASLAMQQEENKEIRACFAKAELLTLTRIQPALRLA